jgi:hypothetical protein
MFRAKVCSKEEYIHATHIQLFFCTILLVLQSSNEAKEGQTRARVASASSGKNLDGMKDMADYYRGF